MGIEQLKNTVLQSVQQLKGKNQEALQEKQAEKLAQSKNNETRAGSVFAEKDQMSYEELATRVNGGTDMSRDITNYMEGNRGMRAEDAILAYYADGQNAEGTRDGQITKEEWNAVWNGLDPAQMTKEQFQTRLGEIYNELGITDEAGIEALMADIESDFANSGVKPKEEAKPEEETKPVVEKPSVNVTENNGIRYDEETGEYSVQVEKWTGQRTVAGRNENSSLYGIMDNAYPDLSSSDKAKVLGYIQEMNPQIKDVNLIYTNDTIKLPVLDYDENGRVTGYQPAEEVEEKETKQEPELKDRATDSQTGDVWETYQVTNEDGSVTTYQERNGERTANETVTVKNDDGTTTETHQNSYSGKVVHGETVDSGRRDILYLEDGTKVEVDKTGDEPRYLIGGQEYTYENGVYTAKDSITYTKDEKGYITNRTDNHADGSSREYTYKPGDAAHPTIIKDIDEEGNVVDASYKDAAVVHGETVDNGRVDILYMADGSKMEVYKSGSEPVYKMNGQEYTYENGVYKLKTETAEEAEEVKEDVAVEEEVAEVAEDENEAKELPPESANTATYQEALNALKAWKLSNADPTVVADALAFTLSDYPNLSANDKADLFIEATKGNPGSVETILYSYNGNYDFASELGNMVNNLSIGDRIAFDADLKNNYGDHYHISSHDLLKEAGFLKGKDNQKAYSMNMVDLYKSGDVDLSTLLELYPPEESFQYLSDDDMWMYGKQIYATYLDDVAVDKNDATYKANLAKFKNGNQLDIEALIKDNTLSDAEKGRICASFDSSMLLQTKQGHYDQNQKYMQILLSYIAAAS